MIDVRCKNCNRILIKANMCDVAIKCWRCKMVFEYKVFNNQFVTSQYDPTAVKGLRLVTSSDTIPVESDETASH